MCAGARLLHGLSGGDTDLQQGAQRRIAAHFDNIPSGGMSRFAWVMLRRSASGIIAARVAPTTMSGASSSAMSIAKASPAAASIVPERWVCSTHHRDYAGCMASGCRQASTPATIAET